MLSAISKVKVVEFTQRWFLIEQDIIDAPSIYGFGVHLNDFCG